MFAIIKRTWDLVLVARGKTWTKELNEKGIVLLDNN